MSVFYSYSNCRDETKIAYEEVYDRVRDCDNYEFNIIDVDYGNIYFVWSMKLRSTILIGLRCEQ